MSQKSSTSKPPAEAVVPDIRRATRRHYSAEDKIRIVLEGLRGEHSIAKLDGRTREARRLKQINADLVQHVGGTPSPPQRIMINRAAVLLLRLEGLSGGIVRSPKVSNTFCFCDSFIAK